MIAKLKEIQTSYARVVISGGQIVLQMHES